VGKWHGETLAAVEHSVGETLVTVEWVGESLAIGSGNHTHRCSGYHSQKFGESLALIARNPRATGSFANR